jgi:hypothetical protein
MKPKHLLVSLLVLLATAPVYAMRDYQENWWHSSLYPDFATFLHMLAFGFWWSLAILPAVGLVAFIIMLMIALNST